GREFALVSPHSLRRRLSPRTFFGVALAQLNTSCPTQHGPGATHHILRNPTRPPCSAPVPTADQRDSPLSSTIRPLGPALPFLLDTPLSRSSPPRPASIARWARAPLSSSGMATSTTQPKSVHGVHEPAPLRVHRGRFSSSTAAIPEDIDD